MSVDLYPHEIAYQRVRDAAPSLLLALRSAQHALDLIARPHSTIRASKQLAREESYRIADALAAAAPTISTTKHTQGEG